VRLVADEQVAAALAAGGEVVDVPAERLEGRVLGVCIHGEEKREEEREEEELEEGEEEGEEARRVV
jgi:hypothetical protein